MWLSTKGRYSLRALMELGERYGEGPVLLDYIAKKQVLSKKYLHALLNQLRAEKIVHSIRGCKGGYCLSRPPKEITIKDIITAVEGPISLVDCIEKPTICDRSTDCAARIVWNDIGQKFERILKDITLEDVIKIKKNKN